MIFDMTLLSWNWGLAAVVISPYAVNLRRPDDGQEADDVGPDFVKDEEADQGEHAQADQLVGAFLRHGLLSFRVVMKNPRR